MATRRRKAMACQAGGQAARAIRAKPRTPAPPILPLKMIKISAGQLVQSAKPLLSEASDNARRVFNLGKNSETERALRYAARTIAANFKMRSRTSAIRPTEDYLLPTPPVLVTRAPVHRA